MKDEMRCRRRDRGSITSANDMRTLRSGQKLVGQEGRFGQNQTIGLYELNGVSRRVKPMGVPIWIAQHVGSVMYISHVVPPSAPIVFRQNHFCPRNTYGNTVSDLQFWLL